MLPLEYPDDPKFLSFVQYGNRITDPLVTCKFVVVKNNIL